MVSNVVKNKKIKKFILIRKTVSLSIILVVIIMLSYFVSNFFILENIRKNVELNKINDDTSKVLSEMKELDRKISLIKSYIDIWNEEISEKQKIRDGIDMEGVKILLSNIAEKYLINNPNISFSIPAEVPEKQETGLLNTTITINFNCLTEYSIYYFLKDLYESKSSFFIIEELEIKKMKNINKELVKLLVERGNADILSVMIKLQWYEISGK